MARPKTSTDKSERLVTAIAVVRVPGGWTLRKYLVNEDASPYEDSDLDTFDAVMGRARRLLAMEGK